MNMDFNTLWEVAKPIVAGQIRTTVLAPLGGALVADGAISTGDEASFIKMGTGIALWAIPAAWAWWTDHGKAMLMARLAKMKPIAAPNATTGEALKAANSADIIKAVPEPAK
jgi:hypothetical protein